MPSPATRPFYAPYGSLGDPNTAGSADVQSDSREQKKLVVIAANGRLLTQAMAHYAREPSPPSRCACAMILPHQWKTRRVTMAVQVGTLLRSGNLQKPTRPWAFQYSR